jgi:nucleotide-binding universal stress UspA family protein
MTMNFLNAGESGGVREDAGPCGGAARRGLFEGFDVRNDARSAADSGGVLAPVDFLEPVGKTLALASRLAFKCGGTVTLLHVVRLNIAGEERGIPRVRLLKELVQETGERLREAVRSARWEVPVETLVCEGTPGPAIVEMAASLRVEAIVMHGHCRRGWVGWLHRNTSLYVARHAPCPIWLLPPGRGDGPLVRARIEPRGAELSCARARPTRG